MKITSNPSAPYYQTGDVIYEVLPTSVDLVDVTEVKGNLIHKGLNNLHTIEGVFDLFETKDKQLLIACVDECTLLHGEHGPIKIPAGLYLKDVVNEYDHLLEESRKIID